MRANIPLEGLSTEELLEDWAWLLGKTFTLIALNNFGDMFLSNEAREIYFLSLATGQLNKLAESSAEFQRLSADKVNQEELFLLKLLTELERAGMKIASGHPPTGEWASARHKNYRREDRMNKKIPGKVRNSCFRRMW
jgi:hypothetical protein